MTRRPRRDVPHERPLATGQVRDAQATAPTKLLTGQRAFELLSNQPVRLVGLTPHERDAVVVAAILDDVGREHVICRFGDAVWDLDAGWGAQNVKRSDRIAAWPSDVPRTLVDDAKAIIYAWHKRGRPHCRAPGMRTLFESIKATAPTLRYLAAKGLNRFDQVRPIHLNDYAQDLKQRLKPEGLRGRLEIFDLGWLFREEMLYPLRDEPWGGRSFGDVCGVGGFGANDVAGKRGATPVIPRAVQEVIFNFAESQLREGVKVFDARDRRRRHWRFTLSHKMTAVRDAALYLLQITSGMRNSESTGLKNECWREEVMNGVTLHWVSTIEHKTGKGLVDFLVPKEAVDALKLMQRYAAPLQMRLKREIAKLEELLSEETQTRSDTLSNGMTRVEALQRLATARASVDNLFLGQNVYHFDVCGERRIEVMSNRACLDAMSRVARGAGVSWELTNHQCRRTFAWTVANSRLGRTGLIFIKWQLKHTSISMSQLYAANPRQDMSLYDEFYEEMIAAQVEVLESWFETDQPLSGGAGKKVMRTRAFPIADRKSLLRHTAETVTIRSTGHSWCLSEGGACVGEGLYDAYRCGDCSDGVIDHTQAEIWLHIHQTNKGLAEITDCGPAVQQRAAREVAASERVLRDLGLSPSDVSASGVM